MKEHHVFPWWAGYFLLNPVRKSTLNPEEILGKYIKPGMKIMDAGCAMGFFSLPMAKLTGPDGKVICIDPQKRMLNTLTKRADKTGLSEIIDARLCSFNSLMVGDLRGQIDLAFAFGVLHEARDEKKFINEISSTLKTGALFLFGEPHVVPAGQFNESTEMISESGFVLEEIIRKGKNNIAVMRKNGNKINYK
ncbi:MAG: class I SAM-dependent methyltransferase [Spirochaetes bacterium]|nr:class I SAM-dependent methyltransferase [Spirochaetota bacterium]